jgi:predicted nucleotidyltransferase component of viral defense system
MNIADRIRRYTARGFYRDSAFVNVLIEETLLTLFKRFPETFIFFGGASLVLFYGSQRYSRDVDLLLSREQSPSVEELQNVLEKPLAETAETIGLPALAIQETRRDGNFIRLSVTAGPQVLFTIDFTKISAAIASEIREVRLSDANENQVAIALPSRNLELLFKAEAFLTRRALKARDAFDIKLLQDSGAALDDILKAHLSDGLAAERLEPEFINKRIAQITRQRCQPELQPFLPETVYRELDRSDFKPLRDAVSALFAEWL